MSGGGGETQTTTSKPLKEHEGFISNVLGSAQSELGQSFVGNQPLVAGSNANIDAGQQAALQAAQRQQGILGQQAGLFGQLGQFGNAQQDSVLDQRLADIGDRRGL